MMLTPGRAQTTVLCSDTRRYTTKADEERREERRRCKDEDSGSKQVGVRDTHGRIT